MSNPLSPEAMTKVICTLYNSATGNLPVVGSAFDLAQSYQKSNSNTESTINSLIRWQCAKSAGTGFITNLPGGIVAFATLPADVTSSLFIQLRMVAAIGHIAGYDIRSDQTRTLAFLCLCGKGAHEICKKTGIKISELVMKKAINAIPSQILVAINKAVGFRLLTKFGKTGIFNFSKMIPLAGGLVGGAFNLVTTKVVGNTAKKLFLN